MRLLDVYVCARARLAKLQNFAGNCGDDNDEENMRNLELRTERKGTKEG
jgi:hypothetical protein